MADGRIEDRELNRARSLAAKASQTVWYNGSRGEQDHPGRVEERRVAFAHLCTQTGVLRSWAESSYEVDQWFSDDPVLRVQSPLLLRCIFGNPFRCTAFDPRLRTETAVALATGIYADRAFDRLPILADALEDAGCDAVELLAHLRGPGPHVRGCWAVDLVLGKE
jgi:hypothetical protein